MGHLITRKSVAERDLVDHADYIALDSLEAAMRFLGAAEATFRFIAANPECGQLCEFKNPLTAGMRVWRIRGFEKYLIFGSSPESVGR